MIRIIAQILKFPADKNFLALFAVFSLAGNCPGKCVAAVSWRATNGRPYTAAIFYHAATANVPGTVKTVPYKAPVNPICREGS